MARIDKEMKQYEKIAEAMTVIQGARESMERLAMEYIKSIDDAAHDQQEAYSDQLIEDKIEIEMFAEDLKFLELQIKTNAKTAQAFGELQTLPEAMDACKSLMRKAPRWDVLGKKMEGLKEALSDARMSVKNMREALSKTSNPALVDLFGRKNDKDPKLAERIADEKKAREARLVAKYSKGANPVASGAGMTANSDANRIDAITEMIDEENRKN